MGLIGLNFFRFAWKQRMRSISFLILPIASLALVACALQAPWEPQTTGAIPEKISSNAAGKPAPAASRTTPSAASNSYKLDAGDRVRIVVSGQDTLSNSYDVGAGGAIEIPSFGTVQARGLNTVQLSDAIARRLKQNNIREPHVAAQVETYRPFTIRGEVANPGQYPYVNNMTTETAIAIAGGLKPGADKNAVKVSGDSQNGEARAPAAPGSLVRPGDTVTVPEER